MYIPFALSCKNALRIKHRDNGRIYSSGIKHMNRPLHLYMLEMFTPYLFKSNRRKTSQEHPSAKERSSVLKTLKTIGTMYIPSALSYKKVASVSMAKNMYPLKRKGKLSIDLFPYFISLFADTDVNAEKKLKSFRWTTGYKIYARMCTRQG